MPKTPREIADAALALWEGLEGKFEPEPEPTEEEDFLPEDTLFGAASPPTGGTGDDTTEGGTGDDTPEGGEDTPPGGTGDDTLS